MPDYLVRFAQAHESFRKVELQALADLAGIPIQFFRYDEDVRTVSVFALLHFSQHLARIWMPTRTSSLTVAVSLLPRGSTF